MSDAMKNETADTLKCPLCERRGEIQKTDLVDRLSEEDLGRKLANFLSIVEAEERVAERCA
jgi:hypothetical protein